MLLFILPLIISITFALLTIVFLFISLYKEKRNGKFNTMASIFSAIITLVSALSITVPMPIILPLDNETETYTNSLKVTIKSDKYNLFKTYYTLDGKDPEDDGNLYKDPINITKSTTVCARCNFLWKWSEINVNAYTLIDDTSKPTETFISTPKSTVSPIIISEPTPTPIIDIKEEISKIKDKYYSLPVPRNIPDPMQEQPVYKYVESGKIKIIKILCGYNNIDYSRIYYFNEDGQLYFAFIFYNEEKENRLYFCNDTLIRYIDEFGVTYDLYDNLDTCEWESLALTESYELFNEKSS